MENLYKNSLNFFLFAIVFFFVACSNKNYELTKAKIIIIKSPKIKFADVGYVRVADKSVELELFSAGKAIEKISINHLICTTKGCMSKRNFTNGYLNDSYPDTVLQNILLGDKIYGGLNFIKIKNGFEQKIQNKNVDILYRVTSKMIYFKDRKNKILLKIKDTK